MEKMEKMNYQKTADLKFLDLCDEIDYWKEKAQLAELDAKYWKEEYSKRINESLVSAQKGVANALLFAMSVTDDADGNLVISKEKRKILSENYEK